MPFGQLSGWAATVVRTTATVVGAVVVMTGAGAVAAVVARGDVSVAAGVVVLVVVELVVVELVVLLDELLLVELEDELEVTAAGAVVVAVEDEVGCWVKGAVTSPRANRPTKAPIGTWPHMGKPRKPPHNRPSRAFTLWLAHGPRPALGQSRRFYLLLPSRHPRLLAVLPAVLKASLRTSLKDV